MKYNDGKTLGMFVVTSLLRYFVTSFCRLLGWFMDTPITTMVTYSYIL